MQKYKILVINPGSTSTKLAVFENEKTLWEKSLKHSNSELPPSNNLEAQYRYRKALILKELEKAGIPLNSFSAVVGRGGLLKPLKGGTYRVNEKILQDLKTAQPHASNLGAPLAGAIADLLPHKIPAFIVDPISVDEMENLARFSGLPEIERKSVFHALNARATARLAAEKLRQNFKSINLIVAHLGGGITISAFKAGKSIDVTHGLEEGPFTPERIGSLPLLQFMELCLSGRYSRQQLQEKLIGKGGLTAYLGTNDAAVIENRIKNGDAKARLAYQAMAYQIAKEVGAMATVLKGQVDAIVLTGGLANSKMLTKWIAQRVGFIARILIIPGEMEMKALALGALRVLQGEEKAKSYE